MTKSIVPWIVCLAPLFQGNVSSASCWCDTTGVQSALFPPDQTFVEARIVFVGFQGADSTLPAWASDLETEIPAFVRAMSGNVDGVPRQDMHLEIVHRPGAAAGYAWIAPHSASYYDGSGSEGTGHANYWVLKKIEEVYDNYWDPPDGPPVDYVFTIHLECTKDFLPCNSQFGSTGLGLPPPSASYAAIPSLIPSAYPDIPGDHQQMSYVDVRTKNAQEAIAAHEFMHSNHFEHPPSAPNYGRYDLMAGVQDGITVLSEGLIPINPFELSRAVSHWAPAPEIITGTRLDREVPPFFGTLERSGRKTYIINLPAPPSPSGMTQAFFLANHESSTPFESKYSGSGLLIWHIAYAGTTEVIRDLEIASGKFSSGSPDPVSGQDALEASSSYMGSASDFFEWVVKKEFSFPRTNPVSTTNPNTNLYASDLYTSGQSVFSGVAIENIRRDVASGNVLLDIYFGPEQVIMSPNGGSIERGAIVPVLWRVRPLAAVATVDFEISDDGGLNYRLIQSGIANLGSVNWRVLQKKGTAYRICIISRGSDGHEIGRDISDSNITVTDSRSCSP